MSRHLRQVDVFSEDSFGGNPVAVVNDTEGLDSAQMQRFAAWTNLSETNPPGRTGRVHVEHEDDTVWVGGHTTTRVVGEVDLDG